MTCSTLPAGTGFISSVTNYVDCQSQTLGSGAWEALSMPGSTLSVVLTGFLTIFIAIIGYNLLLGTAFTIRDGTIAFVKIGMVLALATSWPAYNTLIYNLVVDGPGQLVAEIGPRAGVAGADGTLLQRLDNADRSLAQLAILGPGNIPASDFDRVPPAPFGGFDAFALGGSRILFSITAIAGLTSVRVIAGLMLALGPFFVAFFLFGGTRGLFEGWIRVLAGAGLGSIGASLVLGLELAMFEPWLSSVLARRMSGEPLPTVSTELFVLALLFAILVVAALYACIRLANGFKLPAFILPRELPEKSPVFSSNTGGGGPSRNRSVDEAERTRAAAIASFMSSGAHRQERLLREPAGTPAASRTPDLRAPSSSGGNAATPLGKSFPRRAQSRSSARATNRDKT